MSYEPLPLAVPPGIITEGTLNQRAGRWTDGDLVRFDRNSVVPMAGWLPVTGDPTFIRSKNPIRNLFAWRDASNARFYCMGMADALLVQGGAYSLETISDVTPADYNAGRPDGTVSKGYGAGPYGRGAYGSDWIEEGPQLGTEILHPTVWHMGVRRAVLYALSTSDQRVLVWNAPDTETLAAPLENAPTGALCMTVTPQMGIMTVGDGLNRDMIRWSDNADTTTWAPDTTNNAGFVEFPLIGEPMKLLPYGQDILLFTTSSLYRLSYHGATAGYGVVLVAEGVGPIGPNAIVLHTDIVMWMGRGEFFVFTGGGVQVLRSDVHDWVFDDLNFTQDWKTASAVIPEQNEVYFWYPTTGASEPDRYAALDYEQNAWLKGSGILRTAWINPGVYNDPLAADAENNLYVQEKGHLAGTANMRSFVETVIPPIAGREMKIDVLEQDVVGDGSGYPHVVVTALVANTPSEIPVPRGQGNKLDEDGKTKLRASGKWVSLRYDIASWSNFKLGEGVLYAKPGSKRGRRAVAGPLGDPSAPVLEIIGPQLVGEVSVTQVTRRSAKVSFYVDRDCTWTTAAEGISYSGDAQSFGRGDKLIEVQFLDLYPDTAYNFVEFICTLTDTTASTTIPCPPFQTLEVLDGSPEMKNLRWENITATSASLIFQTDHAGDYYLRVIRWAAAPTPDYPVNIATTARGVEHELLVGDTNPTVNTALDSGCIWFLDDARLELTSDIGDGDPESVVIAPDLTTGGTIVPPTGIGLNWQVVTSTSASLHGNIDGGYQYPNTQRTLLVAPDGKTHIAEVEAEGVLVFGSFDDLAPNTTYTGTITIVNRAGTTQTPVPELTTLA